MTDQPHDNEALRKAGAVLAKALERIASRNWNGKPDAVAIADEALFASTAILSTPAPAAQTETPPSTKAASVQSSQANGNPSLDRIARCHPSTISGDDEQASKVEIPAGMVPWHGGDNAPADWDGGPVLLRNGDWDNGQAGNDWRHTELTVEDSDTDIIAYTCKPTASGGGEREPTQDTVAFVQEWMMNADYEPSQFDRDFAAAIDARVVAFARSDSARVEADGLRTALIRIARMIPGVICADGVSDAFLSGIPDELAHYQIVRPNASGGGERKALALETIGWRKVPRLVPEDQRTPTADNGERCVHGKPLYVECVGCIKAYARVAVAPPDNTQEHALGPHAMVIEDESASGFMPIAVLRGSLVYVQQGGSQLTMSPAVAAKLAATLAQPATREDVLREAAQRVLSEKAPSYHDCIDNGEPQCAWCDLQEALSDSAKATREDEA